MTSVEQWVIATREAQGLPEHVEELSILIELARLVVEHQQEHDADG
jgi:hypothetical protein